MKCQKTNMAAVRSKIVLYIKNLPKPIDMDKIDSPIFLHYWL